MNKIIEQLQNRRSVRDFTGEAVSNEDLALILKTAQRAPTSINAQQISVIYTRNKETIKKIAELAGGQPQVESADVFVTIVADFNRTKHAVEKTGKEQIAQKSAEGIMVGAVDAGIMLNAIQTAAESLGYGTTAIGGIREKPEEMVKLLGLPKNTFPFVGTTLGVATQEAKDAKIKPRVDFETFAFEDTYNAQAVKAGVDKYEEDFNTFLKENNLEFLNSYSEQTSAFYSRIYYTKTAKVLNEQGFAFKDEL